MSCSHSFVFSRMFVCIYMNMKGIDVLICIDSRNIVLITVTAGGRRQAFVPPLSVTSELILEKFALASLCVAAWRFSVCGGLKILTEYDCNLQRTGFVCERDRLCVQCEYTAFLAHFIRRHSLTAGGSLHGL